MPNLEIYKIAGYLSFALGWAGILYLLLRWGVEKNKSISEHAAANKATFTFMAISEPIILILFVLFTLKWLAPTYSLPIIFSVCCIGTTLGLLIAAWVPAVKGTKNGRIHDILAYGAAILMMPTVLFLATSTRVNLAVKITNWICFLLLLVIFNLFIFNNSAQKHHLYFQSAYILIFDIGLLTAALFH